MPMPPSCVPGISPGCKEYAFRQKTILRPLALGAGLGLLLAVGVEVLRVTVGSNLHVVVPGRCYRSAQLSGTQLEAVVRRLGIRTVVNLRGPNPGEAWYDEEEAAARRLGITKVDVRLSGFAPPEDHDLCQLVEALQKLPPPFLIHCGSGSDRSGLGAALYLLLQTDATVAEARRQISLRFGHNPFGSAMCPNYLLDSYSAWLDASGRRHSPEHLRQWIHDVYRYADWRQQHAGCPSP